MSLCWAAKVDGFKLAVGIGVEHPIFEKSFVLIPFLCIFITCCHIEDWQLWDLTFLRLFGTWTAIGMVSRVRNYGVELVFDGYFGFDGQHKRIVLFIFLLSL